MPWLSPTAGRQMEGSLRMITCKVFGRKPPLLHTCNICPLPEENEEYHKNPQSEGPQPGRDSKGYSRTHYIKLLGVFLLINVAKSGFVCNAITAKFLFINAVREYSTFISCSYGNYFTGLKVGFIINKFVHGEYFHTCSIGKFFGLEPEF